MKRLWFRQITVLGLARALMASAKAALASVADGQQQASCLGETMMMMITSLDKEVWPLMSCPRPMGRPKRSANWNVEDLN